MMDAPLADGWYLAQLGDSDPMPVKVTHNGMGIEAMGGWGGHIRACYAIGLRIIGPMELLNTDKLEAGAE